MLFSPDFAEANRPTSRRRSAGSKAPAVLLIGDARPRNLFRTILSQRGYEILDAADGDEGVQLARTLRPDLILVELAMSVRDGWEVNRMLKSQRETYLIPVVATSLATMPSGTYHRARSAGFVDYVTRPIERRHVLEIAGTWTSDPARVGV